MYAYTHTYMYMYIYVYVYVYMYVARTSMVYVREWFGPDEGTSFLF